jgi:hypothetical protein
LFRPLSKAIMLLEDLQFRQCEVAHQAAVDVEEVKSINRVEVHRQGEVEVVMLREAD